VLLSGPHGPEATHSGDPFVRLASWQHWTRTVRRVDVHGQTYSVAFLRNGDYEIEAEGEQAVFLNLQDQGGGLWKVTQDGHSRLLRIVQMPTRLAILMQDGASAEFDLPQAPGSGVSEGAGGDGVLRAPMPGLVRQIAVSVGQTVKIGDPLVVLEAMKMEMTLTATRAGTVAEIAVDVSTQVTEGALLVSVQVEEDR
jgi:3-methylcrotonyl-CoA carboxylase alpha subunit